MKILIDENILYAKEIFNLLGTVHTITKNYISKKNLVDADALMVRSTIQVNSSLLKNSKIKFVGSATSGIEHIDQNWLMKNKITFVSTPGCNAIAVTEYVFSALLWLAQKYDFLLCNKIIGIIGVGNIGSELNRRLNLLGVKTLLCDPIIEQNSQNPKNYSSLEKLVKQADILTFHIPLTTEGNYPTWHLVNDEFLANLANRCIIINTSRGAVIDNYALLTALQGGKKITVVLDVWENEPNILLPLLNYIDIGTAHIAGYTLEGKIMGSIQLFNLYSKFIGSTHHIDPISLLPTPTISKMNIHGLFNEELLRLLVYLIYDIRRDDILFRNNIKINNFDKLRKYYSSRREWSSILIESDNIDSVQLLSSLGFSTDVPVNVTF